MIKIPKKTSKDYLFEFSTRITGKKETLEFARNILRNLQKLGGNPISLAAGAFYYSCRITNTPISKEKIGEVFHISSRTVDTCERRIRNLIVKKSLIKQELLPIPISK